MPGQVRSRSAGSGLVRGEVRRPVDERLVRGALFPGRGPATTTAAQPGRARLGARILTSGLAGARRVAAIGVASSA